MTSTTSHSEQSSMTIASNKVAAYILAGGESRRFAGQIKALQPLNGKTLLDHVIERLRPQVKNIYLNTHLKGFESYPLPKISDDPNNLYNGPLSGLLACMQHLHTQLPEHDWLLIVPCDAPCLPIDLLIRLSEGISYQAAACISYENNLQPTFSMWHRRLLPEIDHAVNSQNWGGLKIFIQQLNHNAKDASKNNSKDIVKVVEYPLQRVNPFMNINSKDELNQAAILL